MNYKFSPMFTLLALDLSNAEHKRAKEIFDCLGRSKKSFLSFVLQILYPDYFESGRINSTLKSLIKKYFRELDPGDRCENPVFINWNKRSDVDLMCYKLLLMFKDGAQDFVIYALKEYSPIIFSDDIHFYFLDSEDQVAKAVFDDKDDDKDNSSQKLELTENSDDDIPKWYDDEDIEIPDPSLSFDSGEAM